MGIFRYSHKTILVIFSIKVDIITDSFSIKRASCMPSVFSKSILP